MLCSILVHALALSTALGASTLAVGRPAEGALAPGESTAFTVIAGEARYLRLRLDQQGVDVALRLFDPGGVLVAEVDGPGGRWVEELHSAVTRRAGTYRVEVRARGEAAGKFQLVLEELRETMPEDVHRLRADVHHHRGRHLRQLPARERQLEALDAFREAADRYRLAGDRRGEADALDQMGGVYLRLGEFEKARDLYERALPLYEAAGHLPGRADALNDLGIALARLGERRAAGEHFQRSLEIFRQGGDRKGQAMALNSLGILHFGLGELEQARERLGESLELRRGAGDRPGEISTLNSLAVVDRTMGRIDRSLDGYARALELVRDTGDRGREALLLFNLATAHKVLGEHQEALDGYRRTLVLTREQGRRNLENSTLIELAETHRDLGRHDEALALLASALERTRERGARGDEARVLMTAGWVRVDLGQPAEAREDFRRALEISRAEKQRRTELHCLRGLARASREEGRLEETLAIQQQALALSRALGDPVTVGDALREMGDAELASSRPQRALDLYRQALDRGREVADPVREAMGRGGLARALRSLGRLAEARAEISTALAKAEEVRSAVVAPEMRASFRATRFRDHELHVALLLELGRPEAAFAAGERARARGLVELLAEAEAGVRAGLDPELAARERRASRRLSGVQSRLIRELSQAERDDRRLALLRRGLEEARAELEVVAEEIRRRHPRYAAVRHPEPLGAGEVRRLLGEDTALLAYSLGEERSVLFVLRRDGFTVHDLAPAPEIAAAVEQFRAAAAHAPSRRLQGRLQQASRTLHEQLIAPAAGSLDAVHSLVIIPDRELHHLPFEALPSDQGSVLERYAVSYAPSASVLASLAEAPPGDASLSFLGIAEPLEAAEAARQSPDVPTRTGRLFEAWSWRPLPGAAAEVRAIAGLLPSASTWIGGEADEARVKSDPAVGRARILHFATHGLVDDREPSYSGLLLGAPPGSAEDGLLQVHEIFDLRLSADLVVLSACETGLGQRLRGEGILGLARAFFYAGARRLVVSLWPAADAATSTLMQAFYRHLRDGRSEAEALARAKRELAADGRFSHPFYWAPFVLVGDPGD